MPSPLPLASVWPSGLNATANDGGAAAGGQGLAERPGVRRVGDIPQPDRAVGVAAGQRAAIGAERHRKDRMALRAAGQGLAERPGVRRVGDIPQPDRAVVVAAGQGMPIRAERHRQDAIVAGLARGKDRGVFSVFSRREAWSWVGCMR